MPRKRADRELARVKETKNADANVRRIRVGRRSLRETAGTEQDENESGDKGADRLAKCAGRRSASGMDASLHEHLTVIRSLLEPTLDLAQHLAGSFRRLRARDPVNTDHQQNLRLIGGREDDREAVARRV